MLDIALLLASQVTTTIQDPLELRPTTVIVTADLNADGIPDVAFLQPRLAGTPSIERLAVVLSDPQGGYGAADDVALPAGTLVRDLHAADADGDGAPDLVGLVLDPTAQRAKVFVWRNVQGGGFAAPEVLVTGPLGGSGVLAFAAGDLQLDGFDDLVVAVDDGAGGRIERFDGPVAPVSPGASGVTLLTLPAGPAAPEALALADLDDDGALDLAIGAGDAGRWARGDGTGSVSLVPGGTFTAPYAIQRFQAVDQDDDGRTDLVVYSYELEIIFIPDPFWVPPLSGGDPPLVPVFVESEDTSVVRGGPAGLTGAVTSLGELDGRLADLDGDGDAELVHTLRDQSDLLVVREALGGGTYGPQVESALFSVRGVAFDDLDGDGIDEVIYGERRGSVDLAAPAPGSSSLVLENVGSIATVIDAAGVAWAVDLDGDGRLDIALEGRRLNRIVSFFAGPDGTFGPARIAIPAVTDRLESSGTWIDLGDDGILDFVSVSTGVLFDPKNARVFLGDGTGRLRAGPIVFAPSSLIDVETLQTRDMDGDGDDDLVFMDESRGVFGWYEQDATGALTLVATASPGPNFSYFSPRYALGDLDGDGLVDVVVNAGRQGGGNPRVDELTVHLALAGGGFAAPVLLAEFPFPSPLRDTNGLFVVDVDGDGDEDIVRSGTSAGPSDSILEAYLGDGTGTFAAPVVLLTTDTGPRALQDLDGDGRVDVLGLSRPNVTGGTSLFWFQGQAAGGFAAPVRLAADVDEVLGSTVADVDQDGDLDLIVLRQDTNQIDWVELKVLGDVGVPYCAAAVPNSTGAVGAMAAFGSARVADGNLELRASGLPPAVFGLFVTGTEAISAPLANSVGTLCVGGQIGRFVQPGQIMGSGQAGTIELAIDPAALPAGGALVSAVPGETRYFQLWHRDVAPGGAPTSNITAGVRVLMR